MFMHSKTLKLVSAFISWPGMIDDDPDFGVCMSWEEEDPPEDVPPVSQLHLAGNSDTTV